MVARLLVVQFHRLVYDSRYGLLVVQNLSHFFVLLMVRPL